MASAGFETRNQLRNIKKDKDEDQNTKAKTKAGEHRPIDFPSCTRHSPENRNDFPLTVINSAHEYSCGTEAIVRLRRDYDDDGEL